MLVNSNFLQSFLNPDVATPLSPRVNLPSENSLAQSLSTKYKLLDSQVDLQNGII